jgi:hypothetical protein
VVLNQVYWRVWVEILWSLCGIGSLDEIVSGNIDGDMAFSCASNDSTMQHNCVVGFGLLALVWNSWHCVQAVFMCRRSSEKFDEGSIDGRLDNYTSYMSQMRL